MARLRASPARGVGSAGLVLGGAALFGTVGTAEVLGPVVPAAGLGAGRLLVAAALLLALAVAGGHAAALPGCLRSASTWWAGLGQACFNVCFLAAMLQAGVAVGTLVAIGATPIITGLLTRQVSRRWLVATGVAVAGLVLLVGGQAVGRSVLQPSVLGIGLALGASASYATYIIAGNAAVARGLPTTPYLAATFGVSAVLTLPLLAFGDTDWMARASAWLLVGYLAVVPTVVAYSLFNRGLRGVRSATASTLGLLEPVVAALLATLVLGERLSAVAVAGAALILVGLVLIVRSSAGMTESPGVRAIP
ncbi:MAG TPA: EamA family transporter [Nocardioidaceae bacterium]|nr:EamA family transporter [Nocardioidaceae bacterium]